jgi:hypothetical protein
LTPCASASVANIASAAARKLIERVIVISITKPLRAVPGCGGSPIEKLPYFGHGAEAPILRDFSVKTNQVGLGVEPRRCSLCR